MRHLFYEILCGIGTESFKVGITGITPSLTGSTLCLVGWIVVSGEICTVEYLDKEHPIFL